MMSPGQMRSLFRNPDLGTPSANPAVDRIGPMPNLEAILNAHFHTQPDIYIRDFPGDEGDPHDGAISASPDIILRQTEVADPVAEFGEGSPGENSITLGSTAFDPNNPFGNTRRNFLYGPGQKNMDFSVVKFIPITETVRGEFRTEFFNLFNWANFTNPNSNIAVPATFGKITSTSAGPRVIQFAFKVNF